MSVRYLQSPIGILRLTAQDGKLTGIALTNKAGEDDPDSATDRAAAQLMEYFNGKRKEFSLETAPRGTPFQRAVWKTLAQVPFGRVVTYGDLAKASAGRTPAAPSRTRSGRTRFRSFFRATASSRRTVWAVLQADYP